MGEGRSVFLNMLLVLGVLAGHSTGEGAQQSTRSVGGESWLLGFGSQVDNAVEVIYRGVQNPSSISNFQIEKIVADLGYVTDQIENRLDQCLSSAKEQKTCKVSASSKKSVETLRRKIINARALIVFFRNLIIMEFNKPEDSRNFSFAHRMGTRIRRLG